MSFNQYKKNSVNPAFSSYGKSFKHEDGDIVIDPITKAPTFVKGFDNILQSIERAVLIGKTTHPIALNFGMDYEFIFSHVKDFDSDEFMEIVDLNIQRAIMEGTPYYNLFRGTEIKRKEGQSRELLVKIFIEFENQLSTVSLSLSLNGAA